MEISGKTGHPLHVVIVGNGMVGHHCAVTLAKQAATLNQALAVTVLGKEALPAYDRVHLSEVFAGKTPEQLILPGAQDYADHSIDLRLNCEVTEIDRAAKSVRCADGSSVSYDKLVLATGSYPFVPPIPGADPDAENTRCFVYRTVDDLAAIRAAAANATRGVVIGGGLLGLECANALKNLGLETHVVEFAPGLMGVQLDNAGSSMLRAHIERLDVTVHTSKATQEIERTEQGVRLSFAEGPALETDLVVFSAGIRPWDQLARDADLLIGERGGVCVDGTCVTSDPSIYAVGECALYDGRIFGLVAPGYRMAEVAAAQICGESLEFDGADMSTKLKLLGVDVGSIGDAHGKTENARAYLYTDPVRDVYCRLNLDAAGKKVVGAVLVGDCEAYDQILQYYLNDLPVPDTPEGLFLPAAGSAVGLSADQLPDTAVICSCHNVSKGQIGQCMADGVLELGEIKATTLASTGCGGCAVLLKSVVDAELEARGIEVDTSICEHFPYTRQELFHLCQVEGIRDIDTLLARHGQGHGCDICKPAAASIFASLYNDYVLEADHVGLQDTNDHMLANMQKDGTYSVVPRIPGGEITPDKLIAIGTVAKRYDLYTKITGGQRIDLFGAQVHELPLIWRELIDAGFETGHAYGKALRTVKSCVGSTWCRYGVQDSVGMALYVENRYKGLRSPHKLKMAVSGCTRECAEAQSKDVGVIATEHGWNLFVAGNGGMRPRHADLFASDLDDETLIAYIDRFLMFYVRTADRLQRTSVWMESLEGGLDYLRDVVINDSLGICAELEAQMAHIVGSYQCEWKTTIDDPEKLKRFRAFVNTDATDDQVVFVREREQKRPATVAEKIALAEVS
ncbi:MAG: nitrite reductase large subunit NirB [Pseudomonadota bacterium]